MTLVLNEEEVRKVLDMPAALEAVEESLRRQAAGEACLLPRRRLEVPGNVILNDMAAADSKSGWMGVKIYSVANGRFQFFVLLFRVRTGELAALIEADFLGQMRTGAATGIATKYMARPDARVVGIIGTGLQARTQLEAIAEVRKVEHIFAYGRDSSHLGDFCREMHRKLGVPMTAADSAEEAVRDADIVVTATTSVNPVLSGAWLAPGAHVNAVGVNFARKRELDAEAVNHASRIAVDSVEQSKVEAGDLIQAFDEDASRWREVHELGEIVLGKSPGRNSTEEITLFKSNGIATWDIAVGAQVLERAGKLGIGRQIPLGELH
jgi:alanine dehydrogenase